MILFYKGDRTSGFHIIPGHYHIGPGIGFIEKQCKSLNWVLLFFEFYFCSQHVFFVIVLKSAPNIGFSVKDQRPFILVRNGVHAVATFLQAGIINFYIFIQFNFSGFVSAQSPYLAIFNEVAEYTTTVFLWPAVHYPGQQGFGGFILDL